MRCELEHANLTVRDIDTVLRFLTTALPGLRVRGRGATNHGEWVHVGTDFSYLALQSPAPGEPIQRRLYLDPGLNHLGFVVDSLAGVRDRLGAAGYTEHFASESHPFRKRAYFYDPEGNEWEFVEYLSDDPRERNDYSR